MAILWIQKYFQRLKSQYSSFDHSQDVYHLLLSKAKEFFKTESVNFPLVEYAIKNGVCTQSFREEDKKNKLFITDARIGQYKNLIDASLKWCKKKNYHVPNTKLYVWISDRIPWEMKDYLSKIPILIPATPRDLNLPLLPDNTFDCLTMQKKFKGQCYNWNQVKKMFDEINRQIKKKDTVIYFKGTDTTKTRYYIRKSLEEYAKTHKSMIIKLDGWSNYEPITETSKYLFLLNLPGHYPWSNRFKYLFLTNSIIINIDIKAISYDDSGWNDDYWISFIDLIMKPGQDFVNIPYDYLTYSGTDEAITKKILLRNRKTIDSIIQRIEQIYQNYSKQKSKYTKMISSYQAKINNLTNDVVYEYLYEMIKMNAELGFE